MQPLSTMLIVLLSTATDIPLAASSMPEPGTRIRVSALAPGRERWVGPFVSLARDTVTMHDRETTGALVAVPTLHVMRFEISRGQRRNALRGAGMGLGIGALLGAGVGYATYNGHDFIISNAGENAAVGAIVYGVMGVVVGGAIGALTHSEHWRTVPLKDLSNTETP